MERTEFTPELILERNEQAALALMCAEEGYKVLHRIIRAEVDRFTLDLLNVPAGRPDEEKLEKLRIAKTAAMLYEGWTNHVNREVQNYQNASAPTGEPVDLTEGILDIGAYASRSELSSFEEGDELNG